MSRLQSSMNSEYVDVGFEHSDDCKICTPKKRCADFLEYEQRTAKVAKVLAKQNDRLSLIGDLLDEMIESQNEGEEYQLFFHNSFSAAPSLAATNSFARARILSMRRNNRARWIALSRKRMRLFKHLANTIYPLDAVNEKK